MTIEEFLLKTGIYPNLLGFNYLVESVEYVKKNPNAQMVSDVYQYIADKHNTKAASVERTMRYLILGLPKKKLEAIGLVGNPTVSKVVHFFALKRGGKR